MVVCLFWCLYPHLRQGNTPVGASLSVVVCSLSAGDGGGGGDQLGLQFFSSVYKYESKRRMTQPSTALGTTACVAPRLLRIILFAFIKLFPSLQLSHHPRRGKPARQTLCSFSLATACRSITDKGYSLIFVIIFIFCFYLKSWYSVVSSS